MVDKVFGKGQLIIVGPFLESWAIVSHSNLPASRHMISCDSDVGAFSAANRLRAFWT